MKGAAQHVGRYWRIWLTVAAPIVAAAVTLRLPLTAALASEARAPALFAALAAAAVVAVPSLAMFMVRARRRRLVWLGIAAGAVVAGAIAFIAANNAQRDCTVRYAEQPTIIGTELTPLGERYRERDPDQMHGDLLLDAGGDPRRLWTRESLDRCRTRVAATYFLWPSLLVLCLLAAAQAVPGAPARPV